MANVRAILTLEAARHRIEYEIVQVVGHHRIIIDHGLQVGLTQPGSGNWDIDWAANGSAPNTEEFSAVNKRIQELRHEIDITN